MSTDVERFKDLFRIRDIKGVAVIFATIALGLRAAISLGVGLHAFIASRNLYFPNLDHMAIIWLIEPVLWVMAFIGFLVSRRGIALMAGLLASLSNLIMVVRQVVDERRTFLVDVHPIQWLAVGVLGVVAVFLAKDTPLPTTSRFREISAGIAAAVFALLMTTRSWAHSGYPFVQTSGWTLDYVITLLPAVLLIAGFVLLWHNPRFLIAVGLLGIGDVLAEVARATQSFGFLQYSLVGLLASALWFALPIALGNLVLSLHDNADEEPSRHSV
jgi:hypothetical protein